MSTFDSQLKVVFVPGTKEKVLVYSEDRKSKTNQGGISGRKYSLKVVKIYESPNPDRCPVRLFEKYVGLLPAEGKSTAFYKYSMPQSKCTGKQWYYDKPVGVNALKKVMKSLAQSAGLEGKFLNHSLHATAATRMFEHGVDEQLIKKITGHKSHAVRLYKRENEDMLKEATSKIGTGKHKLEEFDIDKLSQDDDEIVKYHTVPGRNKSHRCKKGHNCGKLCEFLKKLDEKGEKKKLKKLKLSLKYRRK